MNRRGHPRARRQRRPLRCALLFALALAGCSGDIDRAPDFAVPGSARQSNPDTAGPVGAGPGRTPAGPGAGAAGAGAKPAAGTGDVNRVGIHRLNNTEYDNTVRDLLGVSSTPAGSFIADEKALGFDNIADALGMTEAQYEQYFNAADALVETAFADAALRARIVTCQPASASDLACTQRIIRSFGLRAFRRPLAGAEVERLTALASDARDLGEDFTGSIKQLVKAMLSSADFLYRIELDSDPDSTEAHPLDPYELASRLSYLVWSTLPDDTLFALAESGELLTDAVLVEQLARMLEDERSAAFVSSFAGQWLGMRELKSHQVEPETFPDFDEALRSAMIAEGYAYFTEFLSGSRSMREFFTADVNFVDASLAELYGMRGDFSASTRISDPNDARRGFLGLASFLTLTSFSYRTAPTLRGKWVLQNLLCASIAPPPPNVPELDDEPEGAATDPVNVRERLAEHRTNPECAACHTILDPIGLGLENFDAIGRHRSEYAPGEAIDASGMLPDGSSFDGLQELSGLLAADARLTECASEKLLTYALSRQLVAGDRPYLAELRARWTADDLDLRALLEHIVLSDPFRYRRGEAP